MKKVFISAPDLEDDGRALLEDNGLAPADNIGEAEAVLYQGSLEELFCKYSKNINASAIIPLNTFLMNNSLDPIDLSDQKSLGKLSFDQENIRGVSDKIGELIDSFTSRDHFADISRYMKMNGIELAQNALIYKRLAGIKGEVSLEIFETKMFYNICATDSFGALSAGEVLSKLIRASVEKTYEEKESGAGLGLFMAINASDFAIFRLKKGKQTQVCCIINKYKRLKQYKSKSPALFIFKE
ncbi:MAG: hypothetical protein WEB87_04710 [Bacteriovoracaceae bacterium]